MIRLTKGAAPDILVANGHVWRDEYVFALSNSEPPGAARYRYRREELKLALVNETAGKCAYCESKILHTQHGDTEHILPVSRFPELIVEWSNLTLVCRRCNTCKGAYFDEAAPLINPYTDEPQDHLAFLGPLVLNRPGSETGRTAVRVLELSRVSLIERRSEHLQRLSLLVDEWAKLPNGDMRDYLRDQLLRYADDGAEYAAATRAYLATIDGLKPALEDLPAADGGDA